MSSCCELSELPDNRHLPTSTYHVQVHRCISIERGAVPWARGLSPSSCVRSQLSSVPSDGFPRRDVHTSPACTHRHRRCRHSYLINWRAVVKFLTCLVPNLPGYDQYNYNRSLVFINLSGHLQNQNAQYYCIIHLSILGMKVQLSLIISPPPNTSPFSTTTSAKGNESNNAQIHYHLGNGVRRISNRLLSSR